MAVYDLWFPVSLYLCWRYKQSPSSVISRQAWDLAVPQALWLPSPPPPLHISSAKRICIWSGYDNERSEQFSFCFFNNKTYFNVTRSSQSFNKIWPKRSELENDTDVQTRGVTAMLQGAARTLLPTAHSYEAVWRKLLVSALFLYPMCVCVCTSTPIVFFSLSFQPSLCLPSLFVFHPTCFFLSSFFPALLNFVLSFSLILWIRALHRNTSVSRSCTIAQFPTHFHHSRCRQFCPPQFRVHWGSNPTLSLGLGNEAGLIRRKSGWLNRNG